MSNFDPRADEAEADRDVMLDAWFDEQDRHGKVVVSRDELAERIDAECTESYAEGRKDEREAIVKILKRAGFELQETEDGDEFLCAVHPEAQT